MEKPQYPEMSQDRLRILKKMFVQAGDRLWVLDHDYDGPMIDSKTPDLESDSFRHWSGTDQAEGIYSELSILLWRQNR